MRNEREVASQMTKGKSQLGQDANLSQNHGSGEKKLIQRKRAWIARYDLKVLKGARQTMRDRDEHQLSAPELGSQESSDWK